MASTCRKDPRTAETMRKGWGNGAERLRKYCGKTAGTVRGLSFKAVTLRRCCGNSAERLQKHCGHNAEHGRSRCGRDVGVHSWATIRFRNPRAAGVTGYFVSPEILYPHAKYPRIYCTPLGYLVSPSHSVYYVSPCKIS